MPMSEDVSRLRLESQSGRAWLLLASCAMLACNPKMSGTVKLDGSSTVFPITSAAAKQFEKFEETSGVKVSVGISGTTGGFRKFCAGETDISDASRPIGQDEAEACRKAGIEYVELPIAYDGISIVVNPKNQWANQITVDELKRMWEPDAQGKVTKWSQVRAGWPDKELHLYGAGGDSGTYDYFTQAIVHTERSSRHDYVASEDDDELVRGVAGDESALGFFGYMYYAKNTDKLKVLAVDDGRQDNGAGAIKPSVDTIRNGTYQPLSRPLFIYCSVKALGRQEVTLFTSFYFERGWKLVKGAGYVPLPQNAYGLALGRLGARRIGSMFDGGAPQIGVSIEELLRKETSN